MYVLIPIRLGESRKAHSGTHTKERHPSVLDIEMVLSLEDDWECLERKIEDAEDEG